MHTLTFNYTTFPEYVKGYFEKMPKQRDNDFYACPADSDRF